MDHQKRMMKTALIVMWIDFWEARTIREKLLFVWSNTVLVVVIGWLVLWSPAQNGCAKLRQTLPIMQREFAQMIVQASEAHALSVKVQDNVLPMRDTLQDALEASLGNHGLVPTKFQVVGNIIQIQLKNASFSAWIVWLDNVRRQFKVQVTEAYMCALAVDGQIDLTVLLQLPVVVH